MSPHMCWVCEGSNGLKLRSPVSRPVSLLAHVFSWCVVVLPVLIMYP